jgi:splicing factor 45
MAINNAVEPSPATGAQQRHGLEYYLSTADDDAEINHARAERNYEIKQQAKEVKRMAKKYGAWFPQKSHHPSKYTNLAAYKGLGGYDDKINAFRDFLRSTKSRPERNNNNDSSSPPKEPQQYPPQFGPPSPANVAPVQKEENWDDANARSTRLSSTPQAAAPPPPPRSPPPQDVVPPPPPPPPAASYNPSISAPPVTYSHTISAPPVTYSHTISSAPVHYPQADIRKEVNVQPPTDDYDERPAKKPKVMSFGARMLAKYGHVEGEGLGKNSDGITTHLEAVKRKGQGKISDDGDRDRIRSAQIFEIRGGQRKAAPEESKFGMPSRVVVTWGCCDDVNLDADAERNDGGVRQEMGDIFQTKVSRLLCLTHPTY